MSTMQGRDMQDPVVVFGATGLLGRAAVIRLAEDGRRVRAVVRDPSAAAFPDGVEVVRGDITRPDEVRSAVSGARAVHLSVQGGSDPARVKAVEVDGVRSVVEAAEAAGVERITMISGMHALPEYSHHPGEGAKIEAESMLASSSVPATVFRPGLFAETLARFVRGDRVQMIGRQPHPLHLVVADDLMRNVSACLDMDETRDRTYTVIGAGPAMTMREALELYLARVRPDAKVTAVPIPVMRLINRLFLKGELTRAIHNMSILDAVGEVGDTGPYVQTFGSPRTPFADWVAAQPPADQG